MLPLVQNYMHTHRRRANATGFLPHPLFFLPPCWRARGLFVYMLGQGEVLLALPGDAAPVPSQAAAARAEGAWPKHLLMPGHEIQGPPIPSAWMGCTPLPITHNRGRPGQGCGRDDGGRRKAGKRVAGGTAGGPPGNRWRAGGVKIPPHGRSVAQLTKGGHLQTLVLLVCLCWAQSPSCLRTACARLVP